MRIVLAGSGNVATVLGRLSVLNGHSIMQVWSRNIDSANRLAAELNAEAVTSPGHFEQNADLCIVAVADDALAKVAAGLRTGSMLTVHTAGSMSREVLKETSSSYGVLYPLQSIRKERGELPAIPFFVDANTEKGKHTISAFARTLSSMVQPADDIQRRHLHLAAVVTNNFSNHLFALTQELCTREGIDFTMLLPLLSETVERLHHHPANEMQTGPAVRGDETTLAQHRKMLRGYPSLLEFYKMFSDSISLFHSSSRS